MRKQAKLIGQAPPQFTGIFTHRFPAVSGQERSMARMMKMVIPQAMMDAYHLIAFLEENQLVHFPSCREEDGGDWHFFVSELENGKYTIFGAPDNGSLHTTSCLTNPPALLERMVREGRLSFGGIENHPSKG